MLLDVYVDDAIVAAWQAALPESTGAERLGLLVSLAWALRQRDSARALELARAAEEALLVAPLAQPERRRIAARLALTRVEPMALQARFAEADVALAAARAGFAAETDQIGLGDSSLSEQVLRQAEGDAEREGPASAAALLAYEAAGAIDRQHLALAWDILYQAFRNGAKARDRLLQFADLPPDQRTPALDALIARAEAVATLSSDPSLSVLCNMTASRLGRGTGLVRLAIVAACDAGTELRHLGDYDGAAEWIDWALDRARASGWPAIIGIALVRLGDLLRDLADYHRSREVLEEALACFDATPAGLNKAIALEALGRTELAVGRGAEASSFFASAAEQFRAQHSPPFLIQALILRARAEAMAEDFDAALGSLVEAHTLAERHEVTSFAVDFAEAEAEVHERRPGGTSTQAADQLESALRAGEALKRWQPSSRLLTRLARAWMAAGDQAKSSDYYERALAAHSRETMQRARDRTTALQLRLDAERARAEADHSRRLAQTLADMNAALEHLGTIGREMTADLDMHAVLRSIARHCRRLIAASFVDIWLGRTATTLERSAGIAVEGVERLDLARHAANTRVSVEDGVDWATPLLAGERLIGVLAIRRDTAAATDQERSIFAALAAYGAIALDNGQAYRDLGRALGDLRRTQGELIQQQKHAALGQLVAGVAHEVNTPIGIALTAASHSIDAAAALAGDLDAQRVRVSDVKRVLRDLTDGNRIVVSALERAGRIIDRFKQVAGDAASDPRRRFALAPRIEGVVAALKPRLDGRGIAVRATCPPATTLESYPETLSRVLEQLVDNALVHGFGEGQPGQVEIRVTEADDQIEVLVADTGRGIGAAHRHLVFEPFFTTSRAAGGTGLGLPIVYNLVTGTLGGVIAVDSVEGLGTRVTLTLPREAA